MILEILMFSMLAWANCLTVILKKDDEEEGTFWIKFCNVFVTYWKLSWFNWVLLSIYKSRIKKKIGIVQYYNYINTTAQVCNWPTYCTQPSGGGTLKR